MLTILGSEYRPCDGMSRRDLSRIGAGSVVPALAIIASILPMWSGTTSLHAAEKPGSGPPLIRSARSGPWSAPATWDGGKVPATGSRVQVRQGHTVAYDLKSDRVIRSIHVAGVL